MLGPGERIVRLDLQAYSEWLRIQEGRPLYRPDPRSGEDARATLRRLYEAGQAAPGPKLTWADIDRLMDRKRGRDA